MIHHEQLELLRTERGSGPFLLPDYGRCSIAEIVPTIEALLDGGANLRATLPPPIWERFRGSEKVLLFMVDGLGWEHVLRYAPESPALGRWIDRSELYPLTSVFPSTTPAALTTFHTGLTPQEHGLPEWTVYFDELGTIIETLPFRAHLTPGRDTLLLAGGHPRMLYEGDTVYARLATAHVPSYIFQFHEYVDGAYSRATQIGAHVVPYANIVDLMGKLRERLHEDQGRAYYFVYWSSIDSSLHRFGPYTPEHKTEIDFFFGACESELFKKLEPKDAEKVCTMMVADHGHIAVRPAQLIDLSRFPILETAYKKTADGRPIYPTGGPNDVMLFLEPGEIGRVQAFLRETLGAHAEILTRDEALARGLFGLGAPIARFLKRVGDLLLITFPGHHLWYQPRPEVFFHQLGVHGGLSESEMLVPFALAPLSDLLVRG